MIQTVPHSEKQSLLQCHGIFVDSFMTATHGRMPDLGCDLVTLLPFKAEVSAWQRFIKVGEGVAVAPGES
jgi:hypothetical protein